MTLNILNILSALMADFDDGVKVPSLSQEESVVKKQIQEFILSYLSGEIHTEYVLEEGINLKSFIVCVRCKRAKLQMTMITVVKKAEKR